MIYRLYEFYRYFEIDGIILFFFLVNMLSILCTPKKKLTTLPIYLCGSTLTYVIVYYGLRFLPIPLKTEILANQLSPYWIFFLCSILIALVWSYFCLNNTLLYKLVYTLFFITFVQLYKMCCIPLYSQEGTIRSELYCILDLSSTFFMYFLLFLFMHLLKRVKLTSTFRINFKQTFLVLYFPLSLLFCGLALSNNLSLQNYSESILAGIILTNLPIVYYMLALINQTYEEQRRLDDALLQTRAQLARFRFTIELQDQLKKERHELKNKYFYLQTMLKEKKYEKMESYLESITGETLSYLSEIQTGNLLMDYLLNKKIAEAKKSHIKTYTEVLVPENLPLNEDTLCTILLNLLDNAIEASQKEEDSDLHISVKCTQNYLVCNIRNKTSQDISSTNRTFETTKRDKKSHGLGIKIIRNAVEKENGILNFDYQEGYFTATVMLPFSQSFLSAL